MVGESIAHFALNLEHFLENSLLNFMKVNSVFVSIITVAILGIRPVSVAIIYLEYGDISISPILANTSIC